MENNNLNPKCDCKNPDCHDIQSRTVFINTGWSPRMALWNTVGTGLGALVGLASLILGLYLAVRQVQVEKQLYNLQMENKR